MIRNIEIENCYSFMDATSINLMVNSKAPRSGKYASGMLDDERINKVMMIVGPNGSGKTNLLKALIFLKWFITDSFSEKPETLIPIRPFMLKEGPYAPSSLKVEFSTDNKIFKYSVNLLPDTVFSESLEVLDLNEASEKERKRFKQLFSRTLDIEKDEYVFKSNPEFELNEGIKDLVRKRKNASILSAALITNHSQSQILKRYWENTVTLIKQFGEQSNHFEYEIFKSSEFYFKNESFKKSMEQLMAQSDLGLMGVHLDRIEVPEQNSNDKKKEWYLPYGKHVGLEGKVYNLPFYEESSGTQRIYVLLSKLLPALNSGGVAIVDEIEADLHPGLLPKLIDLFISKKTNPKGAQLLFTCHATPILNDMDKYQVVIVEKNEHGISEAWRLDDVEGVRNDDNFFAKYNAGAYGGIPNV